MRLTLAIIVSFILMLFAKPVLAENMYSDSYQIRFGNFNMTSGLKSSTSYSLTDTVGQTAAGLFSSAGYSVKAGFQYMYTLFNFSFVISSLAVDLGTLTPSSFSTANNNLIVSAPGQGYSVKAYEIHRLQSGNSDYIPDTVCDTSCNETSASVWNSTSSYGFGYNMSGDDIPTDFINNTYFRPFPDFSLGDSAATVMASTSAGINHTSTVTYKANISPVQSSGSYETAIVYIASPAY